MPALKCVEKLCLGQHTTVRYESKSTFCDTYVFVAIPSCYEFLVRVLVLPSPVISDETGQQIKRYLAFINNDKVSFLN